MTRDEIRSLAGSALHNVGVAFVSFAVALVGVGLDALFGIERFRPIAATICGGVLLAAGFLHAVPGGPRLARRRAWGGRRLDRAGRRRRAHRLRARPALTSEPTGKPAR